MASILIVDTDLIIDFLRGRGHGTKLVRKLIAEHQLRITSVTAFELRVGADFHARRDDIVRLCRSRTVPLDMAAALRGGQVAAQLRQGGQEIGMADCMQAGICLRYDLPFATRNRKHFQRIDGLRLVQGD